MVPILILYTLKRLKVISITDKNLSRIKSLLQKIFALVLLLILTSTHALNNPIKEKPMVFQIMKNQKVIGTINMIKTVSGDSITYNSESNINAKFVLSFKIIGKEKSVFRNGTLVYSSVYRTLNRKVKANHSIVQKNRTYNIKENNKTEVLNIPNIQQNLITLYFNEPNGIASVFCDNQKEMIDVSYLGDGKYKVEIANGKYNIFHYKNGACVKVEAVSPMFDVVLMPL
ncbi:DUF6134 family protein [Geojedonia litorea]|uniref:DUF6134 family protein n=1 Tax=Geojedonia litorea TaxID=1268269 RepID=A0ABV9N8W0_9FLAO